MSKGLRSRRFSGPLSDVKTAGFGESDVIGSAGVVRLRLALEGAVQGVGFRPFVFRLASSLGLSGWVGNSVHGVTIEVEGQPDVIDRFVARIPEECPSLARIDGIGRSLVRPTGSSRFEIRDSRADGRISAAIQPDLATCRHCLEELFDPNDRRFRYPFINCTHCGPRYSILEALPYDRPNTSMKTFTMCTACRREYDDPANRRFHAQPNACSVCGPHLEFRDREGHVIAAHQTAIEATIAALTRGQIVAVKGLGGFHLFADAGSETAVRLLRERKQREDKPFALMFPGLRGIRKACRVTADEEEWLRSVQAPIVILKKTGEPNVTPPIAPSVSFNRCLGVMLPSNPLHHLLMRGLDRPMVATSGNLTDEPICTDETEALARLGRVADAFLVHDRPIVRRVDDSIVRRMAGRPMLLRRARGYAPLPVPVLKEGPCVFAVGAHLKSTIALSVGASVFVSPHIGDLGTEKARTAFQQTEESLTRLYQPRMERIVCDRHPDYFSTHFAQRSRLRSIPVQHHYAHILACMGENRLEGTVFGIAWDGSGHGTDGTIWGGEFLLADTAGFTRMGHLKTFGLPGGEQAVREPRRSALGLLFGVYGSALEECRDLEPLRAFTREERSVLVGMLARRLHTPSTSSMGRLFDGVASLLGLCQVARFEGQAATMIEDAIGDQTTREAYLFRIERTGDPPRPRRYVVDWSPMIREVVDDVRAKVPNPVIATKFHNTLVESAVHMARLSGQRRILLSGGCFQNAYLTETLVERLRQEEFSPYWHQWIPPNDGGISYGQAVFGIYRQEDNHVPGRARKN